MSVRHQVIEDDYNRVLQVNVYLGKGGEHGSEDETVNYSYDVQADAPLKGIDFLRLKGRASGSQ